MSETITKLPCIGDQDYCDQTDNLAPPKKKNNCIIRNSLAALTLTSDTHISVYTNIDIRIFS